jgi:hypothetical protein
MERIAKKHVFISTEKMEAKGISENIMKAAGIVVQNRAIIKISNYNPIEIKKVLEAFQWNKNDEYLVNITGGTKIMSQLVTAHFSNSGLRAKVFYMPYEGNTIIQLHPQIEVNPIINPYELSLNEYLWAHGFKYSYLDNPLYPFQTTDEILQKVLKKGGINAVSILSDAKQNKYQTKDQHYYMGTWFEEWCYSLLKEKLKLDESHIALSAYIKNKHSIKSSINDNEIDIAFIYKNKFFICECKTYNNYKSTNINKDVYKLASISKNLGLKAIPILFLCTDIPKRREIKAYIEDMKNLFGIYRIFSLCDLKDPDKIIESIKSI